jgi:hypothetical protein
MAVIIPIRMMAFRAFLARILDMMPARIGKRSVMPWNFLVSATRCCWRCRRDSYAILPR